MWKASQGKASLTTQANARPFIGVQPVHLFFQPGYFSLGGNPAIDMHQMPRLQNYNYKGKVEYILQIEVEQLAASPTTYVLDCGRRKDPAQAVGLLLSGGKCIPRIAEFGPLYQSLPTKPPASSGLASWSWMCNNVYSYSDDKQKKTELMKRVFAEKAASSSVELLQRINRACKEGGKIEAVTLSGGYTNYSYKLFVLGQPDLAVFAKLSFEYALWNPDKNAHYDLQRTVCEYEVMSKMAEKTPECVVAPLACYDIEDDGQKMKLL
eukprot:scaffold27727_cov88-Skeletonema_dohrnii-CCMP3373.AAC.2